MGRRGCSEGGDRVDGLALGGEREKGNKGERQGNK